MTESIETRVDRLEIRHEALKEEVGRTAGIVSEVKAEVSTITTNIRTIKHILIGVFLSGVINAYGADKALRFLWAILGGGS